MAAKVQRSFTGSEYDHVAMLLRFGNSDLVILEATETNVNLNFTLNQKKYLGCEFNFLENFYGQKFLRNL